MSALDIKVKGESLDLPPNEDDKFFITKQLNDILQGIENRQADFTSRIALPATIKNRDLLNTDRPINSDQYPAGYILCQVTLEGLPVLEDANIIVVSQTLQTINVAILSGSASFFNLLSNESLRSLPLGAYQFNYDYIGFAQNSDRDAGIVTADSVWADVGSYEDAVDRGAPAATINLGSMEITQGGYWFYIITLVEEIFIKTIPELKYDISQIDPQIKKYAVACPVKLFYNALVKPPGYTATGKNPMTPQNIDENGGATLSPTVFDDPFNLWTPGFGAWTIPEPGTCIIELNAKGIVYDAPIGQAGKTTVVLNVDGQDVVTRTLADDYGGSEFGFRAWEENIRYSFPAAGGELVRYVIRTGAAKYGGVKVTPGLTTFKINKEGNNPSRVIQPQDYLPDMSIRQFMVNFLKWFNLVPVEKNRTVIFIPFDKIIDTPPKTKELDRKDYEAVTYLPNYGQQNILKYADNERLIRLDTSGQIAMQHTALPVNQIILELDFSAADQTILAGVEHPDKVCLAHWGYTYTNEQNNLMNLNSTGDYTTQDANELKVGDLVRVGGTNRQVIQIFDNKSGRLRPGANLNSQDWLRVTWEDYKEEDTTFYVAEMVQTSGTYRITQDYTLRTAARSYKVAKFTPNLLFGNLINSYFARLRDMLLTPLVIRAYFNFTLAEFSAIDNQTPIYIPSLGLSFYINKVEQFKRLGSTRVELIRI